MKKLLFSFIALVMSSGIVFGRNDLSLDQIIDNYNISSKDMNSVSNIANVIENIVSKKGETYRGTLITKIKEIENLESLHNNVRLRAMLRKLIIKLTPAVVSVVTGSTSSITTTTQTGTVINSTGSLSTGSNMTGNNLSGSQSNSSINSTTTIPSVINSTAISPSSPEVALIRYSFGAANDDLKLTDFYLYNSGSADLSSIIKTVTLYDGTGNKLAVGSVLGTGVIYFSLGSNSSFIIPFNTSKSVVVVKAAFNDVTPANSGKTIQLKVGTSYGVLPVNGTANGIRLVSQSNGNTVTNISLSNEQTPEHLIVKGLPLVTITDQPTYSNSYFNISALNNRIVLTGITFDVTTPAGGPTTYILYKDTELQSNIVATGTLSNGTLNISFTNGVEISAGDTKKFILTFGAVSGTPQVNAKRIIRLTDLQYIDKVDNSTDVLITNISKYSNVGLPSPESTYSY